MYEILSKILFDVNLVSNVTNANNYVNCFIDNMSQMQIIIISICFGDKISKKKQSK